LPPNPRRITPRICSDLIFDRHNISKIPEHKVEIDTLHQYNATSKGKPAADGLVGRTVWDVLADAWMSRRWWLIAFVAIALLLGLAISHVQTRPGKDVSLFGISLYTKGGASDLRENR
jgi:hypothetical protein